MNIKKVGVNSISGIVVVLVVLAYAVIKDDEALLGTLVKTVVEETLSPDVNEADQQEIITMKLGKDGDVIKHGSGMSLAGELDFTGKKGDILVFQKQDDVWVEIGRHLTEDEL